MARSGVGVAVNSLDDEIQLIMEMKNSDMVARGWIGMAEAKELARRILGLVEDWERMKGGE